MAWGWISIKGGHCVWTNAKGQIMAFWTIDNDIYKIEKAECKQIFVLISLLLFN
jgi:hypothetical protein